MIRRKTQKCVLSAICFAFTLALDPAPADAQLARIDKLRQVIKWLVQPPPKPPPLPPVEAAPIPRRYTPKPPLGGEIRLPGSIELPPEMAAEIEKAVKEAVARTMAEQEAARSDLRSFVEARWREAQPPGTPEPPADAGVRITIEADGLSREEFGAVHRRVLEVFRGPAGQPAADRLHLMEVNSKDAYVVLANPTRGPKYVLGLKWFKRAIEGAVIIGVADMLGADELVDRGITCVEEDIDLDDQVCAFLTLIGGILDLATWDSIGAQTVPTELVLDPVKERVPGPAPASGG